MHIYLGVQSQYLFTFRGVTILTISIDLVCTFYDCCLLQSSVNISIICLPTPCSKDDISLNQGTKIHRHSMYILRSASNAMDKGVCNSIYY